jgi:hypothetical protein
MALVRGRAVLSRAEQVIGDLFDDAPVRPSS